MSPPTAEVSVLCQPSLGNRHRLRLHSAGVVGGDRHHPDELTQELPVLSQAVRQAYFTRRCADRPT
jgi:hypothetical protein